MLHTSTCESREKKICLIMLTSPCNEDPLTPHFYIVKLRFTGIFFFFLTSALKHRSWVLVRTASVRRFKRVPTIFVLSKNKKNITVFHLKIIIFTAEKYCNLLHRHVCVMLGFLTRALLVSLETQRHHICSEQQKRRSDCANAQADLRLCCSHICKNRPSYHCTIASMNEMLHFCIP